MRSIQSLLFSFSSVLLIGIFTAPSEAVDRSAVEFVKEKLAQPLEDERLDYCNVCTTICPRLFNIIKTRGTEGIYDGEDDPAPAHLEPFITPMVEALEGHFGETIAAEDCENLCTPLAKDILYKRLDDWKTVYQRNANRGLNTGAFPPAVFDLAVQLLRNEVEADVDDIYSCKDDVEERPSRWDS